MLSPFASSIWAKYTHVQVSITLNPTEGGPSPGYWRLNPLVLCGWAAGVQNNH